MYLKNPDEINITKYPSILSFINEINNNLKNSNEIEEKYSFNNSKKLKNFVGIVYLSSLINLYLCVESSPGYGKTTAARAIAKMREISENRENKFLFKHFIQVLIQMIYMVLLQLIIIKLNLILVHLQEL